MTKKERNGKQHIKHACRRFEPSEMEIKQKKYIEYVLSGMNKSRAAEKAGISVSRAPFIPTKETWDAMPEKGRGSKYSFIHFNTSAVALKKDSRYRVIRDEVINYLCPDYFELQQKAQELEKLKTRIQSFKDLLNII